ncbi:MAG: hypothetical protein DI539_12845 [Flavobacterium psychrophilum]|nr:MAG: hypothetical protein DI539_12845 [Flavobacterium psychrophilum]
MEENKKNPLDGFLEILEQQHKSALKNVNSLLYDDILNTSEIIEKEKDKTNLKEIVGNLRDRFKNENLNQVTDIFIYCQSFLSSNEEPLPMPSQLCISIGKLFTNENLHYTAGKVYSRDEIEGGSALSFLGYLAMHQHNTPYVLDFIKENFEGFSQNKKTECVFQLKEVLPDNEIARQIIENSGITKYELTFSTASDSTSRPITFRKDYVETDPKTNTNDATTSNDEPKAKSPWWKFWQ